MTYDGHRKLSVQALEEEISGLYRRDSRKVYATLIRLLGDIDLAEEALQEAFTAALGSWAEAGVPKNPTSWLVSTGRFKAIDILRRRRKFEELGSELAFLIQAVQSHNEELAAYELQDDRLRLIFTCCHPAIDPSIQVPLTLREVCGLTTPEIASAFLTTQQAMAQRIVRGKAKIRHAGIPYVIPELKDLPVRLDAVLRVIYLVYNEGYAASSGETPLRASLSREAIRLGRTLHKLLPEPEVKGLVALMLLHESRHAARLDENGDIVLLKDQKRSLWDRELIAEGDQLLSEALSSRRFGSYTLQAAISGVHARAATAEETDWREILGLYNLLLQLEPSPVVALNRAVAVAMVSGPETALRLLDEISAEGYLLDYALAHSARAEWLLELSVFDQAARCFEKALELSRSGAEKRFLENRLAECRSRARLLD